MIVCRKCSRRHPDGTEFCACGAYLAFDGERVADAPAAAPRRARRRHPIASPARGGGAVGRPSSRRPREAPRRPAGRAGAVGRAAGAPGESTWAARPPTSAVRRAPSTPGCPTPRRRETAAPVWVEPTVARRRRAVLAVRLDEQPRPPVLPALRAAAGGRLGDRGGGSSRHRSGSVAVVAAPRALGARARAPGSTPTSIGDGRPALGGAGRPVEPGDDVPGRRHRPRRLRPARLPRSVEGHRRAQRPHGPRRQAVRGDRQRRRPAPSRSPRRRTSRSSRSRRRSRRTCSTGTPTRPGRRAGWRPCRRRRRHLPTRRRRRRRPPRPSPPRRPPRRRDVLDGSAHRLAAAVHVPRAHRHRSRSRSSPGATTPTRRAPCTSRPRVIELTVGDRCERYELLDKGSLQALNFAADDVDPGRAADRRRLPRGRLGRHRRDLRGRLRTRTLTRDLSGFLNSSVRRPGVTACRTVRGLSRSGSKVKPVQFVMVLAAQKPWRSASSANPVTNSTARVVPSFG